VLGIGLHIPLTAIAPLCLLFLAAVLQGTNVVFGTLLGETVVTAEKTLASGTTLHPGKKRSAYSLWSSLLKPQPSQRLRHLSYDIIAIDLCLHVSSFTYPHRNLHRFTSMTDVQRDKSLVRHTIRHLALDRYGLIPVATGRLASLASHRGGVRQKAFCLADARPLFHIWVGCSYNHVRLCKA
jgi:hypothetical protein